MRWVFSSLSPIFLSFGKLKLSELQPVVQKRAPIIQGVSPKAGAEGPRSSHVLFLLPGISLARRVTQATTYLSFLVLPESSMGLVIMTLHLYCAK